MSAEVNIAENVKRVRGVIAEAAAKTGRAPGDVTLVAASKTKPAAMIKEAIAAAVDAVGENRVQELLEKKAQGAYDGVPLHFIGHIQSNKAGKIVGTCGLIESVGSTAVMELIGKRAVSIGTVQNILIEVNIGTERQKSGVLPEMTEEILAAASQTGGINVLGLMAVPPLNDEIERTRHYFDAMFHLFIDMSAKKYDNVSMRFLSMGMSDSYAEAILAGANMVRVGSAIFGAR